MAHQSVDAKVEIMISKDGASHIQLVQNGNHLFALGEGAH